MFFERGLPHRRVEEFKYTDLRALVSEAAPFAAAPTAQEARAALAGKTAFSGVGAIEVAIVNGYVASKPRDGEYPEGIEILSLADALTSGHRGPFFDQPGRCGARQSGLPAQLGLHVGRRRHSRGRRNELAGPVHLRFVTTGEDALATATRVLVVIEDGASVTLIESHESGDGLNHQPNDVVEIVAGDRSKIAPCAPQRRG